MNNVQRKEGKTWVAVPSLLSIKKGDTYRVHVPKMPKYPTGWLERVALSDGRMAPHPMRRSVEVPCVDELYQPVSWNKDI